MANIMITTRCNLHCEYCFANNQVNQNNAIDMTLKDFSMALKFSLTDNTGVIGIIGGEPTIHNQFKDILNMIINNPKVQRAEIYTNGIELNNYLKQVSNQKFSILFNCNTTPNISDIQYSKMVNNIDQYFSNPENTGTLGINVYNDSLDCEYIFKLSKQYNLPYIRISMCVPPVQYCCNHSYKEYIESRQSKLMELAKLAKTYDILLNFDCDCPPICYLYDNTELLEHSIIKDSCYPIVDINPSLEATRCFGTSHLEKVSIKDFPDMFALRKYFIRTIDRPAVTILPEEKCHECDKLDCFCGCLRFKTNNFYRNEV